MEDKCRAIVVKAIDYRDNDKILKLLSPELGLVSAIIRGVKKHGSKLKFAAQPFCFCEYILAHKGDKRSVVGADIVDSFYPLREDITKLYAASCALNYVKEFVQEEPSADIFILTLEFFKTLCYTGVRPHVALSGYLMRALSISGYELNVAKCHKCRKTPKNRAFFNFDAGSAVCEDCHTGMDVEINPMTLVMLKKISESEFSDLEGVEFPPMIERKGIKLLSYFIELKAGVKLDSINEFLMLPTT